MLAVILGDILGAGATDKRLALGNVSAIVDHYSGRAFSVNLFLLSFLPTAMRQMVLDRSVG